MGESLRNPEVAKKLDDLKADTDAAARELKLDMAQAAIDAAGLVDPTPISDACGAVFSAARGDWFGACMSLVSMIPYAGDALGKTAKGAKLAAKIVKLKKRMADNVLRGRQIVANALKKDAAAIRAQRAAKQAEKIEEGVVQGCKVGGNRFGTQSPKEGWVNGNASRGDGPWDPAKSGLNKDKVAQIEKVTGGRPVQWKDGHPDFSEYTLKTPGADGKLVEAKVEIKLDPTGNREADFVAARQQMAER